MLQKKWTEVIDLSSLEENKFYKFVAKNIGITPTLAYDFNDNYVIYVIEYDKDNGINDFDENVIVNSNISNDTSSIEFDSYIDGYESGTYFLIYLQKIEKDKLLTLLDSSDVIYLSKSMNNKKIDYTFEKYIYNDTDNDVTIVSTDKLGQASKVMY